ncbi:MAG: DUF4112 domain-containing protein [Muribaculaceae bacterium]|nr:DUF4112 domain-containing protein [Muribaculaceae bacterium]
MNTPNSQLTTLHSSKIYNTLQRVSMVMDKYYLDAAAGLIPGGVGDIITALISLVYVYVGARVVKSPALSVALLNNIVRDLMLGLIPFYVGDVIDVFHRSNRQNMRLVEGYVSGDEQVVRQVHARVWQSVAAIVLMLGIAGALIWGAVHLVSAIF